jgi:ligand-binding SRPBCC domain-containing protein
MPPRYELRCSLHAPLPIGRVFRAFEEPRNLAKITPGWLRFIIRTPGQLEMRPGLHIDYTIRWLGLPMPWRSVISHYDPPRVFVDEQVRGPYRYWHHEHAFQSDGAGTVVSDCVRYSLPLGPLGAAAHSLMVKRQLLGIFRFRQRAIAKLLGVECRTLEAPVIRPAGAARG